MKFCLNLKPNTNDVYWRNFLIFRRFFVHLLRALATFVWKIAFVLQSVKFFKNQHVFFLIG